MNPDAETKALIEAYLEGSLETAGLEALRARLTADPELRRELAATLRLDGLLYATLHADTAGAELARVVETVVTKQRFASRVLERLRTVPPPAQTRPRRRPAHVWLAAAAGLALAVAGGLWLYPRLAGAPALGLRLTEIHGAVAVTRAGKTVPVSKGLALHEGDRVTVTARSTAALTYAAEPTRLELQGATATFATEKGAKRVKLAAGTLLCTVAPQKLPLEIQTPQAVARVLGTRFTLAADPAATRLEVMAGLVRLTRAHDQASVDVPAGHEAAASRGAELRVKPTRPPGLLLDLDFEDGILPAGSSGPLVAGPRAATSRFCVTGVLDRDNRIFRVNIQNGSRPLFTYRAGAVLAFDYWVRKQTGAIDVYFWNDTRSVSPNFTVWAPAQEQWTRIALRLSDFKKEVRDGDIISDLTIQTTPGGNELFVDNIHIETEDKP